MYEWLKVKTNNELRWLFVLWRSSSINTRSVWRTRTLWRQSKQFRLKVFFKVTNQQSFTVFKTRKVIRRDLQKHRQKSRQIFRELLSRKSGRIEIQLCEDNSSDKTGQPASYRSHRGQQVHSDSETQSEQHIKHEIVDRWPYSEYDGWKDKDLQNGGRSEETEWRNGGEGVYQRQTISWAKLHQIYRRPSRQTHWHRFHSSDSHLSGYTFHWSCYFVSHLKSISLTPY